MNFEAIIIIMVVALDDNAHARIDRVPFMAPGMTTDLKIPVHRFDCLASRFTRQRG